MVAGTKMPPTESVSVGRRTVRGRTASLSAVSVHRLWGVGEVLLSALLLVVTTRSCDGNVRRRWPASLEGKVPASLSRASSSSSAWVTSSNLILESDVGASGALAVTLRCGPSSVLRPVVALLKLT